jgi:sugar-phosphatase
LENVISSDNPRSATRALLPGRSFSALLFDMDGTLLSSIAAAERIWGRWAQRHDLDVEAFLPTIHGIQTIDTIRRLALPGVDPEVEAAAIIRAEIDDLEGIEEISGAADFLRSLPADRWAIVTSATRELAARRLAAAGLPLPALIVTAEDVERSKPAPDGFLLAATRLGFAPADCAAFEDSPAGIAAAEAAGATVIVITAAHPQSIATPHLRLSAFTSLTAKPTPTGSLELWEAHADRARAVDEQA